VTLKLFLSLKKKQKAAAEKPVFQKEYLKRYCPKKNNSFAHVDAYSLYTERVLSSG